MDQLQQHAALYGLASEGAEGSAGRATGSAGRATAAVRDLPRGEVGGGTAALLSRLVEDEIVPCLLREHLQEDERTAGRSKRVRTADGMQGVAVAQFAQLVLAGDMTDVHQYVDAICAQGASLESIYTDLLAPAARHMNALEEDDRCAFSDVTIGMMRMQQVLRALGPQFGGALESPQRGRRVLLVPAPGEQHAFGLFIVADFFARAGWEVWTGTFRADEALRLLRDEWFDVVGVSVGRADRMNELAAQIGKVRTASRNRAVGVLVGGAAFLDHPEYVERVGADAMVIDGLEAPLAAERLLARRANEC